MWTRKDYLDGKCTHSDYYSQMVENTDAKRIVLSVWDEKTLSEAYEKCEYLNSLPIKTWDELANKLIIGPYLTFSQLGDMNTLSSRVCVLKEAARQIIKDYKNRQNIEN